MRDKLIELLKNAIADVTYYSSDGEPVSTIPFGVVENGYEKWLADYLIAHGVTVETGGDLLPRESVINGVLMQMQASSSPVCMEEFLRNLDGVTVQKWISVSERLPKESGYYLVHHKGGFVSERYFYEDAPEIFAQVRNSPVTHWMPLPEAPKEDE